MTASSHRAGGRIALFVPSLRGGGAERVMVNLAIAFGRRGLEVDLVLLKSAGPYLREIPPEVRVVDLKASRLLTGFVVLVGYLRHERPRVMLSAMKHANVAALLAALFSGSSVRMVISEHNAASVSLAQSPGLKTTVLRWLMQRLYPAAVRIVAVSSGVADDLGKMLGLGRDRIRVIPNPIVSERIVQLSHQAPTHPWLLDKTVPVVLSAGRLSPQKDFPLLLRAFARARKKLPLRLVILGEGEQRPELEALTRELGLSADVALPGFVDNPFACMRRADLFVLPSRWEGFGNVLVEAMACGVPVVSTDCPSGPAEILENGKWGRLVPVGDADALAQAMLATLANPGVAPVERAMDFSVDRAADAYLSVLLAEDKDRAGTSSGLAG